MTVIMTSSPSRSLKLVPKMMLASGSAAARISSAASVTSNRLRLDEPVMLNRMPWAPAMSTSRSGLAIACRAASTARFSPDRAADAHERRAGVLHDRAHVGEVEVDESGHGDDVADALDALAEHVVDDAEGVEDAGVLLDDVLEPVVGDRDQRVDLGLELLGRLLGDELALARPRSANGLVTTPIVSAPLSLAIWATTGAAPEPVPPPSPAVMKTMSESSRAWAIFSESSSAARWPIVRVAAGAETAGDLVADPDLVRGVGLEERLRVGVAGDELHAHHLGPDHPVDGVAAAAADTDDADQREVLGIGTQRHRALLSDP